VSNRDWFRLAQASAATLPVAPAMVIVPTMTPSVEPSTPSPRNCAPTRPRSASIETDKVAETTSTQAARPGRTSRRTSLRYV
jgi:hypothetical protein